MSDVHIDNISVTVALSFLKHLYLINSMRNFVKTCKVYAKWITVNVAERIYHHGSNKCHSCQYVYSGLSFWRHAL